MQFTYRDSRAGDPDLQTHIAVSNKVRAIGADGVPRWLALDGRPSFDNAVAASEFYNTRARGVRHPARRGRVRRTPRGRMRQASGDGDRRQPDRSVRHVLHPQALIRDRYADLAKRFQSDHGREPTTIEAIALHQQATLETRAAKHEPRSLAEQRQQWRTQAIALFLDLAADRLSVTVTCRVLGFSTQAFYKWRKAPLSQWDWDDAHLINAARDIHADDLAFGYRFIADELPGCAIVAGENRVARLCSQERIWSIVAKKRGLNRRSGPASRP